MKETDNKFRSSAITVRVFTPRRSHAVNAVWCRRGKRAAGLPGLTVLWGRFVQLHAACRLGSTPADAGSWASLGQIRRQRRLPACWAAQADPRASISNDRDSPSCSTHHCHCHCRCRRNTQFWRNRSAGRSTACDTATLDAALEGLARSRRRLRRAALSSACRSVRCLGRCHRRPPRPPIPTSDAVAAENARMRAILDVGRVDAALGSDEIFAAVAQAGASSVEFSGANAQDLDRGLQGIAIVVGSPVIRSVARLLCARPRRSAADRCACARASRRRPSSPRSVPERARLVGKGRRITHLEHEYTLQSCNRHRSRGAGYMPASGPTRAATASYWPRDGARHAASWSSGRRPPS